ncbi:hypothetical protein [Burkholderia territorii]|uniref:hypothetical protein n=1 Tax=Burkholderia territorii TaxID=1503055 RepID=UPI0018C4676E|nr:hypothetical protein [Burkholderia territorii]
MNGNQATCGIGILLKAAPGRTGGIARACDAGQSSDYRQPAVENGCEVGYFRR